MPYLTVLDICNMQQILWGIACHLLQHLVWTVRQGTFVECGIINTYQRNVMMIQSDRQTEARTMHERNSQLLLYYVN